MTLPNDISRCIGHAVDAPASICEKRETCERYNEPVTGPGFVFYLTPQVPGPCLYYRERREAPRSEAEGSHPLPSPPP